MSETTNTQAPVDAFEIFMSLEDVNQVFEPETKAQLQSEYEQYKADSDPVIEYDEPDEIEQEETTDWSFLEDGGTFEDESKPSNSDDLDIITSEDESTEVEGEQVTNDYNIDDALDVDLDTIVTINNNEYTIDELYSRYRDETIYQEEKAALEAEKERFNAQREASISLLELNTLECDKQIAEYQHFDFDWYAENDPKGYIENKRYLERIIQRKNDLMNEQLKIEEDRRAQENEAFREKSRVCVEILKHDIPDWNEQLYGNLMQHAIDFYGADPKDVEKWNTPSIFKMLNDAYRSHHNILKAKATIKRQKVNGKYLRPGVNNNKGISESAKLAEAEKAYASGRMSQSTAFDFLID